MNDDRGEHREFTREENLEEKYEENLEETIEGLINFKNNIGLILSLLESTKIPCEKRSRAKVLNYFNLTKEYSKIFDEQFPDGIASEIASLSKQYEEWQAEKEADPPELTGGHEGNKDFL